MTPIEYTDKVQKNAYLKGAFTRLDNKPRESPYLAKQFTKAFFDGWDRMDIAIHHVANTSPKGD